MHDVGMTDIAVGEVDQIDGFAQTQCLEFALRENGNALRICGSRQRGRITTSFDTWNLCRGECNHPHVRIVAEQSVEVVEIASRLHRR